MVQLGPELTPEAGVTMAALAALGALCTYIVAFGLVKLGTVLAEVIFFALKWALKHIPFGKRIFNLAIRPVEETIINLFGRAAQALDGLIAHSWHDLAKLTWILGREIEGLALDIYRVSSAIGGLLSPQQLARYLKALLHPIRAVQEIERKLRRAEQVALAHIRNVVLHGVYPRLKVAEGEIAHVIEWDIANLRARANRLERRAAREFRWIRSRPWLIASAAMTATVAICLRRLGLGWLRCRNWRKVGPGLCGLPVSLFETLALGALGYLAVVDPVDIAKVAIRTEETMHAFVKRVAETNG